ncbi:MAG: protein phosphatase 2C domain-containing protein [Cocleimonas sp.]|nr:protein phosphatase 2C domain-containing protein [Cocleimonas sp.]
MNQKSPYSFDSTGSTDVGCVRKRNEDNILLLPDQGLWVIADGAGGHSDGHVASQLIVDNLKYFQKTDRIGNDVNHLYKILNDTNEQLLKLAQSNQIIGSTVSALISDGDIAVILWAGDSPLYRLRQNQLTQVIEDHNRVEEFLRQGFNQEECDKIPQSQQLTHALGAASPLIIETKILNLREGDLFLICSDGLTKELNDTEISAVLTTSTSIEEKQKELISQTLFKGARDNTSVIIVELNLDN